MLPSNLIGQVAEFTCQINDIVVKALADSGSQVTSLSQSCYDHHFSHLPLIDISNLLTVASVSGDCVPYSGYFDCEISIQLSCNQKFKISVPVLVVPDTDNNNNNNLFL